VLISGESAITTTPPVEARSKIEESKAAD